MNIRTSWSPAQFVKPGKYTAIFKEEHLIFATGTYYLTLGLSTYERPIHYLENAASFRISNALNPEVKKTILRTSGVGLLLNPMGIEINLRD